MKKTGLAIVIVASLFWLASCDKPKQQEYLIVNYENRNENCNAALVITDSQQIRQIRKQMVNYQEGNKTELSGNDYSVSLLKADTLVKRIGIKRNDITAEDNQPGWFACQLMHNPSYYIYNLQIAATEDPLQLKKELQQKGLFVCYIDGVPCRYKTLSFIYNFHFIHEDKNLTENELNKKRQELQDSLAKITTVITKIEQSAQVVNIRKKAGFDLSDTDDCEWSAIELSFKNDTDLTTIQTIIKNEGGTMTYSRDPAFYYIQLLDKSNNISEVKNKLSAYNQIQEVYPFYTTDLHTQLPSPLTAFPELMNKKRSEE